jgi:drug/metabolite transporter (DMT)-like permease
MTRAYAPLLFTLAAIWGASYLFIKVGVRDFEPSFFIELRLLIGGALLFAFLAAREGTRKAIADVRGAWRPGLVFGVINGALPFTLIAWGETHIDSGVAAIANASVPIFVALLAIKFNPGERSTGLRLAGIIVGLVGVGVLAGVNPAGGAWGVIGTLAVVLASFSYACGGLYGQRAVGHSPGPVLATASLFYGALVLLPLAIVQHPDHTPGWKPVASVIALAVGGTAIAQLILFRMLRLFGAARVSLVTYLMPVTALVYGAAILGEDLRPSMLGGLGLILGGVALGSGVWRPIRRTAAVET